MDEAADFLRLSRSMIHKLIKTGDIPAQRFGTVRSGAVFLASKAGRLTTSYPIQTAATSLLSGMIGSVNEAWRFP